MSVATTPLRRSRALHPPPAPTSAGTIARYLVSVPLAAAFTFLQVVDESDSPARGVLGAFWPVLVVALTAVAGIALWYRRRWPLPVALVAILASILTQGAQPFAIWAYVSLCARRDWRIIVPAAAVQLMFPPSGFRITWAEPGSGRATVEQLGGSEYVLNAVFLVVLTVVGLFLGQERELRRFADDLSMNAERERQLAVLGERNRIAREMHDVLAHRMSLVSLNAGVLAHRPDLAADETHRIARLIQENAHESLAELRGVLRTLRDTDAVASPQPTLRNLSTLLEEANGAAQQVEVSSSVDLAHLPDNVGRHAYRILQEALTNARKHAPGALVRVRLGGSRGEELTLRVTNRVPARRRGNPPTPGAGLGLVGLGERCEMLGGDFAASAADGLFTVSARLPWGRG